MAGANLCLAGKNCARWIGVIGYCQSQWWFIADAFALYRQSSDRSLTGARREILRQTAAGDTVAALLTARSFADAVEIQIGFTRRSLGAIVDGSTRRSEIGFRLTSDATTPVMGRVSAG
jgi:hypothetical protein